MALPPPGRVCPIGHGRGVAGIDAAADDEVAGLEELGASARSQPQQADGGGSQRMEMFHGKDSFGEYSPPHCGRPPLVFLLREH